MATFSNSPSDRNAINIKKREIKKALVGIGYPAPNDLVRLEPSLTSDERDIQELVEEINSLLDE